MNITSNRLGKPAELLITKTRLKGWSACVDGYRWFLEKFPQEAEFAEVYTALQADERYSDAGWLIDKVFAELDTAAKVQQTVLISAATTGDRANAATTGDLANAATTGYRANAATTGYRANAATTGYRANAATTGYGANAATTGEWANAATTGDRANAATTGEWANAATTGDRANAATTGYGANAATTGYRANAATTGEWAIAASLGVGSKAKAGAGGAIVLAHRKPNGELIGVFASMVGQNGIKADAWYEMSDAGPVEVSA